MAVACCAETIAFMFFTVQSELYSSKTYVIFSIKVPSEYAYSRVYPLQIIHI